MKKINCKCGCATEVKDGIMEATCLECGADISDGPTHKDRTEQKLDQIITLLTTLVNQNANT